MADKCTFRKLPPRPALELLKEALEKNQKKSIAFLGRQYYRLATGAGTIGLPVTAILLVFNTYGIWKQSLEYYAVPLVPFTITGALGLAMLYWVGAFVLEQTGIYREVQSHANREINPELAEACERIKKIAEKMDV